MLHPKNLEQVRKNYKKIMKNTNIHLVTRVQQMENIVKRTVGAPGELTIEICKQFGLTEFDPTKYIELETLGSGAFGVVKKCKYIPIHEFHAVKKVSIQGTSRAKMIDKIASFLVESEIFKKLHRIQHPNIASFKGEYYIIDPVTNKIESLVLVTEAGDYTLAELFECRKVGISFITA